MVCSYSLTKSAERSHVTVSKLKTVPLNTGRWCKNPIFGQTVEVTHSEYTAIMLSSGLLQLHTKPISWSQEWTHKILILMGQYCTCISHFILDIRNHKSSCQTSQIIILYHYLRPSHRHTRGKVCLSKKADNPLFLACHQHLIPNFNVDSIRIQTDPGQRLLSWSWWRSKTNVELRWQNFR